MMSARCGTTTQGSGPTPHHQVVWQGGVQQQVQNVRFEGHVLLNVHHEGSFIPQHLPDQHTV